ncbi:MAG TPA: FkbM family methyltransferase [Sunxiuqinia sp.]|nr:FkbM family methyltransferase [Sunxiuqinia sp.]
MQKLKHLFWKLFTAIDARLKFPNLKAGEIGIQCGFDMDAPVTSDLFSMQRRTTNEGLVYGIDPDPENMAIARQLISESQKNIRLIQAALGDEPGETSLRLGKKRGWNQTTNIPLDSTVEFQTKEITVPISTLSQIIEQHHIPFERVRHINLTINGCEYQTLLGMKDLLQSATDLSLTVIAGRYDETGTINDKNDFVLILELLQEAGFQTRFKRIHQLFWWGFVVKLLMQQNYVFNKKNYGVIFAAKGRRKLPWFQSFS